VQCKRYASSIGEGYVLRELFKFLLFALRNPRLMPDPAGFRYELWTARDVTKTAKEFFKEPQNYFLAHADELPKLVKEARARAKVLAVPVPGMSFEDEEQKVIALARRLKLDHVNDVAIARRLQVHRAVRCWFFRSPDDFAVAPDVQQVGQLIDALSRLTLERLKKSGHLASRSYLPPYELLMDFAAFLDSGDPVFVLTGGSGHGKTAWAAHMLSSPPPQQPVLLIRGEDLSGADHNIAETIARLLKAYPIPQGLSSVDMTPSVWNWLDMANRVLVVDGLDRAPEHARDQLPNWINNTIVAMTALPLRLVLISRNEEWSMLRGSLDTLPKWHQQLGLLSDDAARPMYELYGLPPNIHQNRPLRTPSLIRRFSELKSKLDGRVTRATVLERSIGELKQEIARKLGKSHVQKAFHNLSSALGKATEPYVRPEDFESGTMKVIDELHRQDYMIDAAGKLRPASDDVAEYLISLQLDWRQALNLVAKGRKDPIFFGAIAMVPQLPDRRNELGELLETVFSRSRTALDRWFELAARILIEVEDHSEHMPMLRRLFEAWDKSNMLLSASNLYELMGDLRLPLADQFELLMLFATGEDEDDWRWKFWLDAEARGRFVTPWAKAVCRTVRENPVESLPFIEQFASSTERKPKAVALALVLEAAVEALPDAFDSCIRIKNLALMHNLARAYPIGFARFALDRARQDQKAIDELAECLWEAVTYDEAREIESAGKDELHEIAASMLALGARGRARLKLLLCSLMSCYSQAHVDEITRRLDDLDEHGIWWLARLAGPETERVLETVFERLTRTDNATTLGLLSASAIPAAHWPLLAKLLAQVARSPSAENKRAAAVGLEGMLYGMEHQPPEALDLFADVAEQLAADEVGKVRRPLIFYAASDPGSLQELPPHVLAFRNRLIELLVNAEDGSTLKQLRWKLGEWRGPAPFAAEMLRRLEQRFGTPASRSKL